MPTTVRMSVEVSKGVLFDLVYTNVCVAKGGGGGGGGTERLDHFRRLL